MANRWNRRPIISVICPVYMPGHHLYTYKELKGFVSDISEGKDSYKEQRKRMLGTLITPSDNYCKSILDKLGIRK